MKYLMSFILLFIGSFSATAVAQPGGGGGGNTKTVGTVSSTGLSVTSGDPVSVSNQTYTSTGQDENAVQVNGGTLTMTDCTITKTGSDTSDGDGSSFYGINSAICVNNSGTLTMKGGTISTSTKGANGIVAYNGKVYVSDVTIHNTQSASRGIHATGGGTIVASNLTVTTEAETSSTIATDRGGGTVTVWGGNYTAKGGTSAVLYSTGTITAHEISGESQQGEIAIIEGDNSIEIDSCNITAGSSKRGMMILQSGSGDATGYNGYITVNGGTLTVTGSSTPLLEVPTVIKGTLTLNDVNLSVASNELMKVDYNTQWSTHGGTGNLILATTQDTWTYSGTVSADSYSNATVTVRKNVIWNGAMDTSNAAKSTTVTIDAGGVWSLTGNSYVDKLVNNGTIYLNGYTLNATSTSGSGSQYTTGIETITTNEINNANVYSIDGRIVKQGVNSLDGLNKGIYIINGKKYIKN
jgi:hypothetical protein